MTRAIVGLGSNILPRRHMPLALAALRRRFRVVAVTPAQRTPAIDRPGQPDYLNAAALVETDRPQAVVEAQLKALERGLGRVRVAADVFAARTMDLDLVVWDGRVVDPDVARRGFLRDAVRALWGGLDLSA